ncbi:MAG: proprotein convertase P-domain-containing protein [Myxococcota bacterium]
MYGAREYRSSHVWLLVCLFALTGAACAEQDATFSHVNDVGPDAAAGSALATAELAAASDPFVEIVSPLNNQTYTYSAPGIAITVSTEIGNGVAGPGGGQYKLSYNLDGVEAQQVPAAGAFTFQGVLWGRHHLSVQLIDAGTGEALTNPESRDAIYVRVTAPCVPSQGGDACEDGLQCSNHTCQAQGGIDNGVCMYGGTPDCCDSDMECEAGNFCQNNQCVECLNADHCWQYSDDDCKTPTCDPTGTCIWEPVPGCCNDDNDCDDNDFCTTEVCNVGAKECVYEDSPDPLCCNLDTDCVPSDPCIAYMCYVNPESDQQYCRYGPKNINCCENDGDCLDNNPCTLDTCDLPPGEAAGQCVFNQDPTQVGCCIVDSECDDDDPATIDKCAANVCQHHPDPGYCHMDPQSMVVINELMIAPGHVPDTTGEWIELYNAGDPNDPLGMIDLEGWTLTTSLGESHTLTYLNAVGGQMGMTFFPEQYMVVARSADNAINGGFLPDYQYGADISLPDPFETGSHAVVTITLRNAEGVVIDEVTYDTQAWGDKIEDGASASLAHIYTDNSGAEYWEASGGNLDPMLNVKYGTPGSKLIGSPKGPNDMQRSVPHAGCVVPDGAHSCAFAACSPDLRCDFPMTVGCCEADGDCNDWDSCTNDTCDVANGICNAPQVVPDCCTSSDDCDDANPCNMDRCIGSVCRYSESIMPNCCTNDLDCDDDNQCTTNTCNIVTQQCEPAEDVVLPGGQQCCTSTEECDDADPSTTNLCNFNTTPPTCLFVEDPNYCDSDTDACDDFNKCTADFCDVGSQTCQHQQLPGCCEVNSDCAGDGNACTNEVCNSDTGDCYTLDVAGCCLSNFDCDDGNPCTTDSCTTGNQCHNTPIQGCCNTAADCDDGVPCTLDTCFNGQCVQTQEEACCTPGASSQVLVNECGPDPDGLATCFVWTCSVVGQCIPIQNPTCCNEHDDCSDGDPCTTDLCTTDNQCKNLALSADNCCVANQDCPTDQNVCTTAVCDAGSCGQHAIAGCSTPVEECGTAASPLNDAEDEGWTFPSQSCWTTDNSGQLGPDAHAECFGSQGATGGDEGVLVAPSFNPFGHDTVSAQFNLAWQVGNGEHSLNIRATYNENDWSGSEVLEIIPLSGSGSQQVEVTLSNLMVSQQQVWIGFHVASTDASTTKVSIDDFIVATGNQPYFVQSLNTGKNYSIDDDRLFDGGEITSDLDSPANKVFWVHDPDWELQTINFEIVGAPEFVTIKDVAKMNLYGVVQLKLEVDATDSAHIGEYNIALRVTDCGFSDTIPLKLSVGLGAGYVLYTPLAVADDVADGLAALLDANNLTYQRVTNLADVPDFDKVIAVFMTQGGGAERSILTNSDIAPLLPYLDGGGALYLEGSATFVEDPQTLLQGRFDVAVEKKDGGVSGSLIGVGNFYGQSLAYSIWQEYYADVDWLLPKAGGSARKAWQTDLSKKATMLTNVDPVTGSRLVASSMLMGITQEDGATPTQVMAEIIEFLLTGYGPCTTHTQCATGEPCEIATCVGGQCVIEADGTCELCLDDGDCPLGQICLPNGDCAEPEGDDVGDDPTPAQFNCDTTDELIHLVKTVDQFGTVNNVHTKLKIVLDASQKMGTHHIKLSHGGTQVVLVAPDPTNTDTILDIDFDLGRLPAQGSMDDFNDTNVFGDWVLTVEDTTGGSKCATVTQWDLYVDVDPINCASDADCDDGGMCNGAEVCNAGTCAPGTPPNCDDGDGCTVDVCLSNLNEGAGGCDSSARLESCAGAPCSGSHAIDSGDGDCGVLDTCLGGLDGADGQCALVCDTCELAHTGLVETTVPSGGCVTESVDIAGANEYVTSAAVRLNVTHGNIGDLVVKLYSPGNASVKVLSGVGNGLSDFFTTFPTSYDVDMCSLQGVKSNGLWKVQVCNTGADAGVLEQASLWIGSSNTNPSVGQDCDVAIPFSGADGNFTDLQDTTCYANSTTGNCSGGGGHDIVYTFNIPTNKRVTVNLTTPSWDGAAYLTQTCSPGSNYCADNTAIGGTEKLDLILDAGVWFVVVDSFADSESGPYTLEVDLQTPSANGQACDENLDCESGHCQNGYCCDTGDCCNAASVCPASYSADPQCIDGTTCQGFRTDATCTQNRCGSTNVDDDSDCLDTLESDDCALYDSVFCKGGGPGSNVGVTQVDPPCATTCLADDACDPGAHCFEDTSDCRLNLSNGIACERGGHCKSGNCVDGVCCDSGCSGLCESCINPGSTGQCTLIANGSDPDEECAGTGLCGGLCDGGGSCRYTADTVACSECTRCNGAGFCDNAVPADTDPDGSCSTCTTCNGDGACVNVPDGADYQSDCADDGAGSCDQDGQCDGGGACRLYASGTTCVNQTCTTGYVDPNHQCDGTGDCIDFDDIFCEGHICGGVTCAPPSVNVNGVCWITSWAGGGASPEDVCGSKGMTGLSGDNAGIALDQAVYEEVIAALGYTQNTVDPDCYKAGYPSTAAIYCSPIKGCMTSLEAGESSDYYSNLSLSQSNCNQGSSNPFMPIVACQGTPTTGGPDCQTNCGGSDSNCLAGYYCEDVAGVECLPKKDQGEACGQDHQCNSGFCTDGVCCDSVCAGPCRNCGRPASTSTCSELGWTALGSNGSSAVCGESDVPGCNADKTYDEAVAVCTAIGARLCTYGELNNDEAAGTGCGYDNSRVWTSTQCGGDVGSVWTQAGISSQASNIPKECTGKTETAAVRCCADAEGLATNGQCMDHGAFTDPEEGCSDYWCDGGGSCKNSCSNDTDCKPGFWCNGNGCEPKKDLGTGCTADNQCTSGICNDEDGVCCDTGCTSTCLSCKLPGLEGNCTLISNGQDPDEECTGTHGTCGGTCDGAGSCQLPDSQTDCGECRRCSGNGECLFVPKNSDPDDDCSDCRTCDGVGSCMNAPVDEDPHDDCTATDQTTCGHTGKCNGNASCQFWGNDAVVAGQTCTDSIAHPGKTCDGGGSEVDPGTYSCLEYACNTPQGAGSTCRSSCSDHTHCASGYVCDFSDSDFDGRTDDCVATKPDGNACTENFECKTGHCQNGYCCSSGNCCANSDNCAPFAQDPVCDSVNSGGCSGHRVDSMCNGNSQCVQTTVSDPIACAAQLCQASSCPGNSYQPERFCNSTGQCANGGNIVSCDDGNPCTNDTCTAAGGCGHSNADGESFACYNGPSGTQNVGICHGGTRYCENSIPGDCIGQTLPATEKCGDNLDNDCDGAVNEQGAAGCTIYYRDDDQDGYGRNEARCLCGPSGTFTATQQGDCNDNNGAQAPNKPELCSTSFDDNCNSVANEDNSSGCSNYYLDGDSDGYGAGAAVCKCSGTDPFDATSSNDCNDANNNINPGRPELCNGYDDNCNGSIDTQEKSGHGLCGSVPNVPNGAITCTLGQCGFFYCDADAHNVNGVFSDGCERVEDQWDRSNQGNSCGTGGSQSVNYDSDLHEGENHTRVANILPAGDIDWHRVRPRDSGTQGHGFAFDIRFTHNPGHFTDGGEHRFDVYRDGCGSRMCHDAKFYRIASNHNKTGGGCANGNQCGQTGNQNCTGTSGNDHCGSSSQKCCHTNGEGANRWFHIKVWHTSGRAMNDDYHLRVSNSVY